MAQEAPGKAFRKGVTIAKLLKEFPTDEAAEAWFVKQRWPDGIACPHCGDMDIQTGTAHPKMPYRCRGCKKFFSVKTGMMMEGSKIGYQAWLIAVYSLTTNLKGMSSMKLHREIGITQKSAWLMAHKIREAWKDDRTLFGGPVEVDETYVGGLEANKHGDKKLKAGRGTVGKTAVAGVRDRETGKVRAAVVPSTDKQTLQGFVHDNVDEKAAVYTDDHRAYAGVAKEHETVNHGIGEYVRDNVHTNGIESFWAMFKRGHKGTYHKMSKKHLRRYVTEFVGRHNKRPLDTMDQMGAMVKGMEGKRMTYPTLTADNGLPSGARWV